MGLEELSEAFRKQLYIREYVKTLESKIVECDGESVDRGRVVDFYVHFMYIKIAIRDGINVKRGKI